MSDGRIKECPCTVMRFPKRIASTYCVNRNYRTQQNYDVIDHEGAGIYLSNTLKENDGLVGRKSSVSVQVSLDLMLCARCDKSICFDVTAHFAHVSICQLGVTWFLGSFARVSNPPPPPLTRGTISASKRLVYSHK